MNGSNHVALWSNIRYASADVCLAPVVLQRAQTKVRENTAGMPTPVPSHRVVKPALKLPGRSQIAGNDNMHIKGDSIVT